MALYPSDTLYPATDLFPEEPPTRLYNREDGTVAIDYSSVTGLSVTVIEPRP